jgi:hypothetical protein
MPAWSIRARFSASARGAANAVGAGRKIDLRFRDVQEAPRAAGRARTRLVGGDDVVRRRDDVGGATGRGAQGR